MKLSPDLLRKVEALAGIAKPRRVRKPATTPARGGWSITLTVGTRVVSEINRRDHWTTKRRRAEIQRDALAKALRDAGLASHVFPLPVLVTWTRIGWQVLDDDNLHSAFKSLRDDLAGIWLRVDDGDTAAVSWRVEQRQGEPGVEVTIRNRAKEDGK